MFNLINIVKIVVLVLVLLVIVVSFFSYVLVMFDRIWLVFNESDKFISVMLCNNDFKLFYLVQSWIEDVKGNKISLLFVVFLLVQCIDVMMNGQVKVQGLLDINKLSVDCESVFYFNVCEILLKLNKLNILQIVLQMCIKLFW